MRACMLVGAAAVALALLAAGCGEGPVFYEDASVLSNADASSEEKTPKPDGASQEEKSWDPDRQRQIEEEKKQKDEEEQVEEEKEEAAKDAGEIMNVIGGLINEMKFEEAAQKFEEFTDAIEMTANEGMADSDPRVAAFYKTWREELYRLFDIIREDIGDTAKRRSRALRALDNAGTAKRNAGLLKTSE